MVTPQIIQEESITMTELRAALKQIKKRDGELSFRANKTEEYLDSFSLLKEKEAEDLKTKLEKLKIPRFKSEYVNKIVDLLPATPEEVKLVLQGFPLTVSEENTKEIAKVVKEFIPEKS